jgi:hypothetical protein
MNINNFIEHFNINNSSIKCDYLKIMVHIINNSYDSKILKKYLNDTEIKIIESISHRGQWKLFTELTNFEMKYLFTRLNEIEMGSLILFIPNELSFKSTIFIKDDIIYEYIRNTNGVYNLTILSDNISLSNLLKLDLIDLKSYRDLVIKMTLANIK